MTTSIREVQVIDSHTAGEPTRVVIGGGPNLGAGTVAERLAVFKSRHDQFRSAIVNEPRGSDVLVGALLLEPLDASNLAGVIFFNNVGFLGMCGHGAIGVIRTLTHLGKIPPGEHRLETAVGVVATTLHENGEVSIRNVPSFRKAKGIQVRLQDGTAAAGDIAWGGNWFFLAESERELELAHVEALTEHCWQIRQAVNAQGFPEVDHIELFGPPRTGRARSRNFVLCPGKAYDRSPCGTGTSAKLACLAADGKLAENETWIQESIIGSVFRGQYTRLGEQIIPTITGAAHITGEAKLLLDPADPFCWGIRAEG